MNQFLLSLLLLLAGLPLFAQELTFFGGYHTHLFGYSDARYIDADKGDYLKTAAWYSGSEFVQRGVPLEGEDAKKIVLGGSVLVYGQNSVAPKDLYAVASKSIAAETVPANLADRVARFQLMASLFGGFADEWWGAEGGLTVILKGEEEKTRTRYDANGNTVEGAGRGWVFGNGSLMLPNVKFRLGSEKLPNFQIQLYRGQMDPGFEAVQAAVNLPFTPAFALQIGGSFFPTSSIFVEPQTHFGSLSGSLRVGTILNYNNASFTRVGIFEGAFFAASVGTRW